ncbi:hypothetical protein Tco_0887922 [Tanacetum coccineum]
MDRKNVRHPPITINNKFLNSLQVEWSKYVTMTRQKYILKDAQYDQLYDNLSQFKPHVQTSKAKKAARNHDPLALVAHSNVHSSHFHARELQGDAQEDKLTTTMMLLERVITQRYSTPTNNRLRTSLNTRNQAVIQDGRVDLQSMNVGYAGNGNRNAGRKNRNQAANAENGMAQQIEENDRIVTMPNFLKPKVRNAKYFREQMLLVMKYEAERNLNDEENDFMLDNAYGDDTLEELSEAVIMMARIQPADAEPKYDVEVISEVNASQINIISGMLSKGVHEHANNEKLKTVINTSDDDQIDSNIIFNDPYVENNRGTDEHD